MHYSQSLFPQKSAVWLVSMGIKILAAVETYSTSISNILMTSSTKCNGIWKSQSRTTVTKHGSRFTWIGSGGKMPAVERPPIGDTIGDTEGEFVGVEPGDMFGVGFQILSR